MSRAHRGEEFRKAFLYAAVSLQIAAWFAVFYALYYVTPGYKKLMADFGDLGSGRFAILVAVSDFIVVCSQSDAIFRWLLAGFLVALAGFNVFVIKRLRTAKERRLWCFALLLAPFLLLGFQLSCFAEFRIRLLG
jgi:type II secretory pathway component PulF